MRRKTFVWVTLIFAFVFGNIGFSQAESRHLYVLWEGIEPDKCALIWLVKRHVDPKATFKFVKNGTTIEEGIPLDTPDSRIQRRQNLSAFEVALLEYKLTNPTLKKMGRIIWDIEINKWEKKVTNEAVGLSVLINGISKEKNSDQIVRKTLVIYDALYLGLEN